MKKILPQMQLLRIETINKVPVYYNIPEDRLQTKIKIYI